MKVTKPVVIMWLIGLSLCSMLALILTGNLTSNNNILGVHGNDDNNKHPIDHPIHKHRRHSALSAAAKAMKKITKRGIKLIDKKNINRGAEGTVVKDLDRGAPLKENLPEDEDDGTWADDDDSEDEDSEDEEVVEEHSEDEELEKTEETTVNDGAPAAIFEAVKEISKKDPTHVVVTSTTHNVSAEDKKDNAPPAAAQIKAALDAVKPPEKKKKKHVPRVWESNAVAVMKIIDHDAHPHIEINAQGKIVKNEEEEHEEDSSDDEEEDYDDKRATYLALPNLASLEADEAAHTLLSSTNGIPHPLHKRLTSMFQKATSHECRKKIAEHMALFINGFAEETKFPFDDFYYPNTCEAIPRYGDWDNLPEGVKIQDVQYRTYQPPKDEVPEGAYIDNVEELQLLYVILTHDQPEAAIRLIESVYVPGVTKYVIHVDGKEKADPTYERLVEYAKELNTKANAEIIRIVPNKKRVRVNWGGYTMVQATLHALHTVFGLDYYDEHPHEVKKGKEIQSDNPHAFTFHKLVHLASTTYPLASNTEIRDTFASYPLDANFLHIILRPNNPTPSVWNYFVECDDALHRIYRIPALNADRGNGVDIYTSSQWFIISHEFAWYLAKPPKDSFVEYYLEYIEHVVVADEAFFGTVLRNTHFCGTLHNDNFLHLQFDVSWLYSRA